MKYTKDNINRLRVYRVHNPWIKYIGRNTVWEISFPSVLGSNKCSITYKGDERVSIVEHYDVQLALLFLKKNDWYPVKENWFQKICRYVRRSYGNI